jgi:drug/metabolite transporter (DMT)-like permease
VGAVAGEASRLDLANVSGASLAGLGYLIVFGSLVGFASYTWLLRVAPTSLVSTYAYVNPLVAILLGNLVAGEPLSLRVLLAAGVILGGVVLITATQQSRRSLAGASPCTGDD